MSWLLLTQKQLQEQAKRWQKEITDSLKTLDTAYDPLAWVFEPWQTKPIHHTVETAEKDGKIVHCVDLPGVKKEDVSISQEGRTIRIKAERKDRNSQSKIEVAFTAAKDADMDTIEAELSDGVLKMSFAKKQEPQKQEPKTITIK